MSLIYLGNNGCTGSDCGCSGANQKWLLAVSGGLQYPWVATIFSFIQAYDMSTIPWGTGRVLTFTSPTAFTSADETLPILDFSSSDYGVSLPTAYFPSGEITGFPTSLSTFDYTKAIGLSFFFVDANPNVPGSQSSASSYFVPTGGLGIFRSQVDTGCHFPDVDVYTATGFSSWGCSTISDGHGGRLPTYPPCAWDCPAMGLPTCCPGGTCPTVDDLLATSATFSGPADYFTSACTGPGLVDINVLSGWTPPGSPSLPFTGGAGCADITCSYGTGVFASCSDTAGCGITGTWAINQGCGILQIAMPDSAGAP